MKNKYVVYGDTVIIYVKYKDDVLKCYIDVDDFEKISNINWYADWNGYSFYARGYLNGKHYKMHRLILNTPDDLWVDHKDFNTLNNRKDNLENVTQAVNNKRQKGAYSNSKSGVRGVYKHQNKWRFTVKENGKTKHMGMFNTLDEAKVASDTYYK
jgi:hypothetical protein